MGVAATHFDSLAVSLLFIENETVKSIDFNASLNFLLSGMYTRDLLPP